MANESEIERLTEENNVLRGLLSSTESLASYVPHDTTKGLTKASKPPFVTLQNKLVMKAGTANGVFYSPEELRGAFPNDRYDLFLDHEDKTKTWVGEVRRLRIDGGEIFGDLEIANSNTADALIYGARYGISPTIEIDKVKEAGQLVAKNPTGRSFSLVINPAVRDTMLNEQSRMPKKKMVVVEDLELVKNMSWDECITKIGPNYDEETTNKVCSMICKKTEGAASTEQKAPAEELKSIESKKLEEEKQKTMTENEEQQKLKELNEKMAGELKAKATELESKQSELDKTLAELKKYQDDQRKIQLAADVDREIAIGYTKNEDRDKALEAMMKLSADALEERRKMVGFVFEVLSKMDKGASGAGEKKVEKMEEKLPESRKKTEEKLSARDKYYAGRTSSVELAAFLRGQGGAR